jgi:hypothetical protein
MNVVETDDDLQALDATLERLRAATDAIGTNLLELERDPICKLLDTAPLTGETADGWAETQRSFTGLWQCFSRLGDVVERAIDLRGRGRPSPEQLAALDELLRGASVEVPKEQVPLAQRDLTDGADATTRCAPDELLATMSAEFDRTRAFVITAGDAWDNLMPRLSAARTTLDTITIAAPALGEARDPELEAVGYELESLASRVAGDPITVNAAEIDRLEARLTTLQTGIAAAEQLRDESDERVQRARSTMAEIREATRAAAAAHEEVRLKIADVQVPPPPAVDRALAAELDAVVASVDEGDWRATQRALETWTARADDALRDAHECATANRAPIEARNELRGRLDAYYGMAHANDLLEDADASALYDRAHDLLYTAPTDLHEAEELVRRYQDAVSTHRPTRKEPR